MPTNQRLMIRTPMRIGVRVANAARIPSDQKKTGHLLALDGAKEGLHLLKANLLEEGSSDSVVDGCEGVFHTASPYFVTPSNPQAELIEPALNGTLNVLGSCAKNPTVKSGFDIVYSCSCIQ